MATRSRFPSNFRTLSGDLSRWAGGVARGQRGGFRACLAILATVVLLGAGVPRALADAEIRMVQFGLAGQYRPGELTPARVEVTLAETWPDAAVPAWVQWEVPGDDGDILEHGRPVTLNRGRAVGLWLYAFTPPLTDDRTRWTARVFEYRGGLRGAELGAVRFSPGGGSVPLGTAVMASVGPHGGLAQYARPRAAGGAEILTAHEEVRMIGNLRAPDELPDLWFGYAMLETLLWSSGDPALLGTDRVLALREWIRRGGHLVISLPASGNPWGLGETARTELEDLLPRRAPRRDEREPLTALLPILARGTAFADERFVRTVTVHVFRDRAGFDVIDPAWTPVLAMPDGRVPVITRSFGFGRLTLVGVDLSDPNLLTAPPLRNGLLGALPHADVFWNPILGRRQDTPTGAEIAALFERDRTRLSRLEPAMVAIGDGAVVEQEINLAARAGRGLLVSLLLFIAYWVLAGPAGFFALRTRGLVRHAWLAFAVTAALFTIVAWVAVVLLRENRVEVRHLTVLDGQARRGAADEPPDAGSVDPPILRARSWFSLYTPGYGPSVIELPPSSIAGVPTPLNLLASWTPPPRGSGQAYPNLSRIPVDLRRPAERLVLPSRSTSTRLTAWWIGYPAAGWKDAMLRSDPADPVRMEPDARGEPRLRGRILNELGHALAGVTFIWVHGPPSPPRRYAPGPGGGDDVVTTLRQSGQPIRPGAAWRLDATAVWAPGEGLTVDVPAEMRSTLETTILERYVRPLSDRSFGELFGSAMSDERRRMALEMLTIFGMLTPPPWLREPSDTTTATAAPARAALLARRNLGQELDLSSRLTGPALLVIGYVDGSPLVHPLRVRGEEVRGSGRTMVRWLFPLEESTAPVAVAGGSRAGGEATE